MEIETMSTQTQYHRVFPCGSVSKNDTVQKSTSEMIIKVTSHVLTDQDQDQFIYWPKNK